jgi:hypothetical protein
MQAVCIYVSNTEAYCGRDTIPHTGSGHTVKDLLLISILIRDYSPCMDLFMALKTCFLSISKLFSKVWPFRSRCIFRGDGKLQPCDGITFPLDGAPPPEPSSFFTSLN